MKCILELKTWLGNLKENNILGGKAGVSHKENGGKTLGMEGP